MEDIVAVKITLESGKTRYVLTWGRIPEAIDPQPLEQLIRDNLKSLSLGGVPVAVKLCDSLQEAAKERYFYESFFAMCQITIPFGPGYREWVTETFEQMKAGHEIYYLGNYDDPSWSVHSHQ